MGENNIKGIMDTTMDKLRAMVDADTIIGTPIVQGEVTIIPISKAAFGLATGGSDFASKNSSGLFGGGGGAGVTITPVAFLTIHNGNVNVIQIYKDASSVDRAISMAPELIDRIAGLFKKEKDKYTDIEL
ncbi:MAG: sporulation protein YtfJ [Clostridia bacterium]|nr:sporulation protein YtfJ [Clostridia bacterium]